MKKIISVLTFLLFLVNISFVESQEKKMKSSFFGTMKARHIGPAIMSGRISSLDASQKDPRIIYVGAASGGVWKSINSGTTFKPVFDDHIQSIGAIAIDQKSNDTVWVGTGEPWLRNSISVGKGIYKTMDGGERWELMGLEETEHIAKIIINPMNSNIVYVAALGNVWANNNDRGIYKTIDGGKSWEKIFFVNETTGCSDLVMDPRNPNIIYAGMWDFQRKPYEFRSGGAGSGVFKTVDGGKNWEKVIIAPYDTLGRISVAYSSVNPDIIYSLIESKKTGLYRSIDNGRTWQLRTTSPIVAARPFYFSLLVPDPIDTNRIYKPGFTLRVSDDGGYSFTVPFVEGGRVHSDLHALWINPNNNNHMYLGTDGGFYSSYDKGNTWIHAKNLPISQFYHVSVDLNEPYNVYGGLQDNGSWVGPSKSVGGITNSDWDNVGYGDGFNVIPDPSDDNILYWQYQGGNVMRFYKNTREIKEIKPFSDNSKTKLRFNWNTPIVFSPTDKGKLYVGAQYLFRSTNRGDSWEKISPDLTTNDRDKQKQEESGGLTIDNSTAENHCTIYTISESPKNSDIIWVGTDDGKLQVTKNSGKKWEDVTNNIPDLPKNTWCSSVFSSNFDEQTAFVVFDGHRNGDKNVYIFKTNDLGKHWYSLTADNIEGFALVIREDFANPNLLFLGTEYGLYITLDGGDQWIQFKNKVPMVPIYDIVIHPTESDLILGTHGRGIIIIDDISPLRLLTDKVLDSELTIFPSKPYTITNPRYKSGISGDQEFRGRNPSSSAVINYFMKKRHIFGDMSINIYNENGELVKSLPASKKKGINRVNWEVTKKPPKIKASSPLLAFRTAFGPNLPAGNYTIKINKGKNIYKGNITLQYDSKAGHSIEDMNLQSEVLSKSYNLLEHISFTDNQITDLIKKLDDVTKKITNDKFNSEIESFNNKLQTFHKELVSTSPNRISGQIRLAEKVGDIYAGIISYLGKPTDSQIKRLALLEKEFKDKQITINTTIQKNLETINLKLEKYKIKHIKILSNDNHE